MIYAEWYEAYKQEDHFKAIDLAITYAILYPSGSYVRFLKRYVGPLDGEILDALAVKRRNFLKALMEKSGYVNESIRDGKTLLMIAAANGDVATVKALLEKGAVVNTVEMAHGWTPLIYAVWNSDISTIQMLIDNGADLEFKDADGRTVFEHAKLTADPKVQELFENIRQKK